jgi:MFS transporter, YNFM family, putative membrane transport protein
VTDRLHRGTPEFRAVNLALFAAGFATFALMYCVQPLMPVFAADFGITPMQSSLSLSVTTFAIAPALLVAGALAESHGRKPSMLISLVASAMLTIGCAMTSSWNSFLLLRAASGLAFAGLPAASMAYISEEIEPTSVGLVMGLFISGNAIGGMAGRLGAAWVADHFSWRLALGIVGAAGVIATAIFAKTLSPSRHFTPRPFHGRDLLRVFASQLKDRRLTVLFGMGFLVMAAFVTTYNYISFHLTADYALGRGEAGFIFLVYLAGIVASPLVGSSADRVGRGRMLAMMIALMATGSIVTLAHGMVWLVIGVGAITFGFFGAHSLASTWLTRRAGMAKGQASALYLFFYYIGASVAGPLGGLGWQRAGWTGVVHILWIILGVAALLCAALGSDSAPQASAVG